MPLIEAGAGQLLGVTFSVYCAPELAGLGLTEKTTKSKLVFAGIVAWKEVMVGGEPLLVFGSPKCLEALPISPATNGARYAATCVLLAAVPSTLTVKVTVTQTANDGFGWRHRFSRIEGHVQFATPVGIFDAVQGCIGCETDSGWEMDPADETHGAR